MVIISLSKNIKQMALEQGFVAVGITSLEHLGELPYGWVADIRNLKHPRDELPETKSVIMLILHAWDRVFGLQIDSPMWKGYGFHSPDEKIEGYYISYMISMNKAWPIVSYLRENGFKAQLTTSIPFKTTAIACGLGQSGKNTLLVNPDYGPRLGLMAILTSAELDTDEPFIEDLCEDCTRCLDACPTKALTPYHIDIKRCLTYAAENPGKTDLPSDVRELEVKLITTPTSNSYIECYICADVCPVGEEQVRKYRRKSR
jgi:epoxyqueuosine reductase